MTTETQQQKVTGLSGVDSHPATMWATDTTRPNVVDGERQSSVSGVMFVVSTARSESAQGAMDGGDTVTRPVPNVPIDNGNANGNRSTANGVGFGTSRVNTTLTQCEQCGRDFTPRRPWGRFCSAYCRRLAWLGRNPEKAAELAERDRARLRAHIIGNDGEWVERGKVC